MKPDRVLLVDDEASFLEILAERMRARGLDVTCATSGTEAIRLAQEETYDAVVLDLAMPGLDGLETLRRLRVMQPDWQYRDVVVGTVKSGATETVLSLP